MNPPLLLRCGHHIWTLPNSSSLAGHHEGLGGSLLREDAVVHGDHLPDRVAGVVGDAEVVYSHRVALRKDDQTVLLRVLHQGFSVARATHYVRSQNNE